MIRMQIDAPRQQLLVSIDPMLGDALDDMPQVCLRIEADHFCRADQNRSMRRIMVSSAQVRS
jgi:hypothetical protein